MERQEVTVKVLGVQKRTGQEPERIEQITRGTYSFRDGTHYLRYEEYPDDSDPAGKVVTFVKFHDQVMEVTRSGEVESRMVFEEGRSFSSPYMTRIGTLHMEFATQQLWMKCTKESWSAGAGYTLTINGEHMSEDEIRIEALFGKP